jgi:hypothetical protein
MISEKNISATTGVNQTWHEPIPLTHEYEQSLPYPIECLPPIIREAVTSYYQYGKQPLPLIACSALSSISLACQSLANVARDRLLVSLFLFIFYSSPKAGKERHLLIMFSVKLFVNGSKMPE